MHRLTAALTQPTHFAAPWGGFLGLARSLMSLQGGLTLLSTPADVLFMPVLGIEAGARCEGAAQFGLFCLVGDQNLDLWRVLAGVALLMIATSILPAVAAAPLAYLLASLYGGTAIPDGGDQLAAILALLLLPVSLTDWRLWGLQSPRPTGADLGLSVRALVAATAFTLVRIQVSVVYLWASIGKLPSEEWADGSALYYWMRHPTFGAPDWLAAPLLAVTSVPVLTALATWGSLALEFLIGISLLLPRWFVTRILLPAAIAFHLAIMFFLGVSSFAVVMIAALLMLLIRPGSNLPALRGIRTPSPQRGALDAP